MSKTRKIYSPDFKTKLVLELLVCDQTLNQVASKYEVTPKSLLDWKKMFLENASMAFEPSKMAAEYKKEIEELQVQNDQLAKTLGRTTIERDWAVGKLEGLDLSNKKDLVDSKLLNLSMTRQSELLKFNRTSLYYKPKPMSVENLKILNAMDEIYAQSPEYGYRFIHQQLLEDGYAIGKHRTLKYMRILGIEAIFPKTKKLTSSKNQEHRIYPYLLKQYKNKTGQVVIENPNTVWSGDITYIRTNGGFVYLAAVIDWHSKAILSYKISNTMDATLASDALREALSKYPKPEIFNSDQGSQYTSCEHTQTLRDNDIQISMNGKGRSIDNIAIERFFRTLKYSNIYISEYHSIKELKEGIANYMYKYNFKRFHSSIGYQKPMNVYLGALEKVA